MQRETRVAQIISAEDVAFPAMSVLGPVVSLYHPFAFTQQLTFIQAY